MHLGYNIVMEIGKINGKKAKVTFEDDREYFIVRRHLPFSTFRLCSDYFGGAPLESEYPITKEMKHTHLGRVLGSIATSEGSATTTKYFKAQAKIADSLTDYFQTLRQEAADNIAMRAQS
jgi:hypothetical protein